MRELIISGQEEGQRLDRYLGRYLPGASQGFLHKMLRKKNIKYNGAKASGSEKLMTGDRIQIFFSEETFDAFGAGPAMNGSEPDKRQDSPEKKSPLRKQVRVLFENEDILILHKPAGMLTQKAAPGDDSLNDYLLDYWKDKIMRGREMPAAFRPSVANRLDRNTSGIVLCGITVKGLQMLSELLKKRQLEKYYLCIVKGEIQGSRKVYGFLKKDEKSNRVMLTDQKQTGSAFIETWYRALSTGRDASLLKVRLITGKSHQIRAHLASEGHPILGDPKYGDPERNRALYKLGIRHQLLHSSELVIPGGPHIRDDIPEDFARVMKEYHLEI